MLDEKSIQKLAEKIAHLSADYDPNNEQWYGLDTGLGNLPQFITDILKPEMENLINQALNYSLNKLEKAKTLINLIQTKYPETKPFLQGRTETDEILR